MASNDEIFSRPLRIRRVKIVGNTRTQRSVIDSELEAARKARNVRDVSNGIMQALRNLKQADSFEAVEFFADIHCPSNSDPLPPPGPGQMEYTDLVVTVREKRMLSLKAETFVTGSGGDGGVETSVTLNNPTGYTEKVNMSGSYGTKNSTAARLEFNKPRFRGLPLSLNVTVSQDTSSKVQFSSYDESVKALQATLRHDKGRHELGVGTFWRDIMPARSETNEFKYAASGLIIAQAHPSLKNSVSYTYTNDCRDSQSGPREGSLFQLKSEFAGLGGDVSFVKGQVKLQQFVPVLQGLVPNAIFGVSFHTGMLYPLDSFSSYSSSKSDEDAPVGGSSSISDRFWLGGPMTMRGFHHKGVGPRTNPKMPGAKGGDALGGDVTFSLGYSLYMPFPHRVLADAGLRCHLFANVGNLCAFETSFRTLLTGARASVGAGLFFPTPIGRVEANYSYVVRANSRDDKRRFQLGLGVDFL